jgi:hypothetical protein
MRTPPPLIDVSLRFPQLALRAKTTVRLHPRPSTPDIACSHLGGSMLWPIEESWPECDAHEGEDRTIEEDGVEISIPCPLVPIMQLFREDCPGVRFPENKDLLQLLWCPEEHNDPTKCVVSHRRSMSRVARSTSAGGENPMVDEESQNTLRQLAIDLLKQPTDANRMEQFLSGLSQFVPEHAKKIRENIRSRGGVDEPLAISVVTELFGQRSAVSFGADCVEHVISSSRFEHGSATRLLSEVRKWIRGQTQRARCSRLGKKLPTRPENGKGNGEVGHL